MSLLIFGKAIEDKGMKVRKGIFERGKVENGGIWEQVECTQR